MNLLLLDPKVQEFIRSYKDDLSALAFSGSSFEGITVQELIQQIEGYRKTKKKLPLWHSTLDTFFPAKIHIEQTSSEETARYKASLIAGKTCIDVTGGLGIDAHYFSKVASQVTHCELNQELSNVAAHNALQLKTKNIRFEYADGIETALASFYDVVYIDPSRRHDTKGKVFYLKDCEPNVPLHLKKILANCNTLLVKTSPMLDLSVGMSELQHVAEIHIVAVNNEVKELLWLIHTEATTTKVVTVNLSHGTSQKFEFLYGTSEDIGYSQPQRYLYEPNAAIMKSGAFTLLPAVYSIEKISQHSHLYTHEELIDFPGRCFTINEVIPYSKAEMNQHIKKHKAHVSTRNFPESVATIRKKWKLSEGGETYLFFTTTEDGKRIVLKCSKSVV